jgi:chromosomal replication initiation ATPase DnaA
MQTDGRFRFDNFVVGSASRRAAAAARAVAEAPGSAYNPLFIYSGSGLGKTHLIGAIAHHARQLHPQLAIESLSLDEFVESLHAAVSAGEGESFRQRYHRVDLLLLDDVQFLTGHRETQAELLRLFNVLQGTGRQIVLTSDRPPSEIADVDERLLARLAGGLIVDIGAPEYEARVAILRGKCEERGIQFRPGVIEEVARIEFANVRELQGALNRLIAHQALGDGMLDIPDVRVVLAERAEALKTPAARPVSGEFQTFLSDVATVVARQVEGWRVQLGEAIAEWEKQGYRTAVLERAMALKQAPNLDGLLATFGAAVERLRELEREITEADPALVGSELFRDPERVGDAEELLERVRSGEAPPAGPSPAFSRDEFEVGPSNQMAVRAGDAVVEAPGQRYNPLFVHGPSGVGKTHLLHAIGNELVAASGGAMRVACVGTQAFVDELIVAMQEGTIDKWRARYRESDALVLDDVQFVAGKERTQEELFHVFNALYAEGKQIVFTSDRAPRDLEGLEERLRSRFEGGLVVSIQQPDRALRERLYARFLSPLDPRPDAELLAYLAERPAASVREIIGTVHRLAAAADLAGVAVTLELAHAELDGAGAAPAPAPGFATAGVDPFFFDDEKVVWDWPEVGGRVIEELR